MGVALCLRRVSDSGLSDLALAPDTVDYIGDVDVGYDL